MAFIEHLSGLLNQQRQHLIWYVCLSLRVHNKHESFMPWKIITGSTAHKLQARNLFSSGLFSQNRHQTITWNIVYCSVYYLNFRFTFKNIIFTLSFTFFFFSLFLFPSTWFNIADLVMVEKKPHRIFFFDKNIILFIMMILFLIALSEKLCTWDTKCSKMAMKSLKTQAENRTRLQWDTSDSQPLS